MHIGVEKWNLSLYGAHTEFSIRENDQAEETRQGRCSKGVELCQRGLGSRGRGCEERGTRPWGNRWSSPLGGCTFLCSRGPSPMQSNQQTTPCSARALHCIRVQGAAGRRLTEGCDRCSTQPPTVISAHHVDPTMHYIAPQMGHGNDANLRSPKAVLMLAPAPTTSLPMKLTSPCATP